MNQAIQILDGFEVIQERQALLIKAIANGAMVNCIITEIAAEKATDFYSTYQFDLEEQLITYIEDENFNELGEVECSANLFQN